MSALVLRRVLVCTLIFGSGTAALTTVLGAGVAVTFSSVFAYAVNAYWRDRQLRRLYRELREAVEREQATLEVQ